MAVNDYFCPIREEKYINPFTDSGFKGLFGTEYNKDLLISWKIFEKLFNQAEVAKLSPKEMRTYDESLKIYWDNYSVIETAKHEGMEIGAFQKSIQIAREMKKEGEPLERIAKFTGLTTEEIQNL